jgi:hypothetical protein
MKDASRISELVARDPVCSVEEIKKALAGQLLKGGGRTRARTWDPLIKSSKPAPLYDF